MFELTRSFLLNRLRDLRVGGVRDTLAFIVLHCVGSGKDTSWFDKVLLSEDEFGGHMVIDVNGEQV